MIGVKEYIKDIYSIDGFGIPSGPALVYLYQRFGFTPHGSDDYKQVCRYIIPTQMAGVYVSFNFGGATCYIGAPMDEEVEVLYHEDDRRPVREWWARCAAWAEAQGMPRLIDIFHVRGNEELFESQAKTWLQGQGVDLATLTQEQWDTEWGGRYCDYVHTHNERVADAYRQVEPQPKYPWPGGDGEFVTAVHTAVADVLRDMLRPVQVRDVFINILGPMKDSDLGEYDEERECFVNEAERSHMAGFGVPEDAYNDPNLFIDAMHDIRRFGQGDMVAGLTAVRSLLAQLAEGDTAVIEGEIE